MLLETPLIPVFLLLVGIILFLLPIFDAMTFLFVVFIAYYDMDNSMGTRCHNSHSSSAQIPGWRILR